MNIIRTTAFGHIEQKANIRTYTVRIKRYDEWTVRLLMAADKAGKTVPKPKVARLLYLKYWAGRVSPQKSVQKQWHVQCRTMYILRLYSIVLQWCRWTFVAGDFLRIMLQITMRRVLNTILCHLFCAPLPILDAPKYLPVHVCGATISVVVQKL